MLRSGKLLRLAVRTGGVRWQHWSSQQVRSTFIEYFKSLGHYHVASSPVVPWNDPSLDFVNAGMNQFKSVFLGESASPHTRATSSQRCIRVGGKHNDLAEVGCDSYHHTFFEMLGSWSFGDYFKEEACVMAWRLLTEVYQLSPARLYVTYFGGDDTLGLLPDTEVRDIWRAIGVPDERILPFGLQDNFWEMDKVGPCGPCTEIHYDHLARPLASHCVNTATEDMIELWNIVFIQYERLKGGGLCDLKCHFVDTGMGLERVTAVLNTSTSNYNTDLFTPIFSTIQKLSGCPGYRGGFSEDRRCLDTAYRILADHIRMMTVALADGAFPEECYVLQKIMRRALTIGSKQFGLTQQQSLAKLAEVVADTLAHAHPELHQNLATVTRIITHEETNYHTVKENLQRDWMKLIEKRPELAGISDYSSRRIIEVVAEITPHIESWRSHDQKLPGDVVFNLYRTYGLSTDIIQELAGVYGLTVDQEGFESTLQEYKENTKRERIKKLKKRRIIKEKELINSLRASNTPPTNDSAKYDYEITSGHYQFPPVETKILALITDEGQVDRVTGRAKVGVIMETTIFYHAAGGQEGDTGNLYTDLAEVNVDSVDNVGGYLIHWGTLGKGQLVTGERVTASVCQKRRLGCMRHHTATHLLNSAIKSIVGISRQTSSCVTAKDCFLQLQTYEPLTTDVIQRAQDLVKRWITAQRPISRRTMTFQDLLQEPGVTLIPGEIYPTTVHVISTSLDDDEAQHASSLEPCCGTHLGNTGHIHTFVIEDVSTLGHNNTRIRVICGEAAVCAEANATVALQQLQKWQAWVDAEEQDRLLVLDKDTQRWWNKNKNLLLPYLVRCRITEALDDIRELLKNSIRVNANAEMRNEIMDVISKQKNGPIVHLVKTQYGSSRPRLVQAHKLAKDRPMLLLARTGDVVVGRSALPQNMLERGVSAVEWLKCVEKVLGGTVEAPVEKDPRLVANFRSCKITDFGENKLEAALAASRSYIEKFL